MGYESMSLLLLAGGESRRMGRAKANLAWQESTFLEEMLKKARAAGFGETLLSVRNFNPKQNELAKKYQAKLVLDADKTYEIDETGENNKSAKKAGGPAQAICGGLMAARFRRVMAVAVDMVFFSFAEYRRLLEKNPSLNTDIFLPIAQGKSQPLAAVYDKKLAKIFAEHLARGERTLHKIIAACKKTIAFTDSNSFFNVNTLSDFRLARGRAENLRRKIPMAAIVAPHSKMGKTLLIEKIVAILKRKNIRTGVVKSDGHGWQMDSSGKDTWRFDRAGANAVAVVSKDGYAILQKTDEAASLVKVAEKFIDVDLVLLETRTKSILPTLEICSDEAKIITADSDLCCLCAKSPLKNDRILCLDYGDCEKIAALILFLCGK